MLTAKRLTRPLTAAFVAGWLAAGHAADSAEAPAESASADPTATIIARGALDYQQRHVDALVSLAERHRGEPFDEAERAAVGRILANALVSREALLHDLADLGISFADGPARDRLILDLLDFRRQEVERSAPVSTTDPVVVELPPIRQAFQASSNHPDGVLILNLALRFADRGESRRFDDQVPVIQDAALNWITSLSGDDLTTPNPAAIKAALNAIASAAIPDLAQPPFLVTNVEFIAVDLPDEEPEPAEAAAPTD